MDLDRSGLLSADEYYLTASQIFDYCGAEITGKLRVDALMEKFAPFVKTNKAENSYLKSLLDPNASNPEISVEMLAKTLHKYSESHKSKADLDESFNLKSGQAPQDSDSGISSDGFQLLEELQSELREKSHLALQLRSQLDYTDRQHEEAHAALTAERDALRVHLNMLREENMTLTHVRCDYEEACERLCSTEKALEEAHRELVTMRRKNKTLSDQVTELENDKVTLQELLSKSKAECHRINEMYASRQSALLEQNEALRAEHADLSATLHDQGEFVQQIIKEKVQLEMELKDLLNKSNQNYAVLDKSIDVSYSEDQMPTALDILNTDTRFSQDNRILDEESFANALREDQGRNTNISLFDEIRLSFCNRSHSHLNDFTTHVNLDNSFTTIATQTDSESCSSGTGTGVQFSTAQSSQQSCDCKNVRTTETQTDLLLYDFNNKVDSSLTSLEPYSYENLDTATQTYSVTLSRETQTYTATTCSGTQTDKELYLPENKAQNHIDTQTDAIEIVNNNNDTHFKCQECENMVQYNKKLKKDVKKSNNTLTDMRQEIVMYEDNLNILQQFVNEGNERNGLLQDVIKSLEGKIGILEVACDKQRAMLNSMLPDCNVSVQTECDFISVATQADTPCLDCVRRNATSQRSLRRFFWEPVKSLFQLFAALCFVFALCALYGVSRRPRGPCRSPLPWRWLDAADIMDLLLSIEYVSDVPK